MFQNKSKITGALLLTLGCINGAAHAAGVWVEGEAFTRVAPASVKPQIGGWGASERLSGGKWAQVSVEADKVPAEGVTLSYDFQAAGRADTELWGRVGYERIRSPFEWRLDGGNWTRVEPAQNSVDVEELQTWNPVAWLDLGRATLGAGAHTLDVRVLPSKDDKGARQKFIFAADAFYFADRPFVPNGAVNPDNVAASQSAADVAAAARVVPVKATEGATQTATSLAGTWEIAPWDELVVRDRTAPVAELPDLGQLLWKSIAVPSDRQKSRPEMAYVHRYLMRTRVELPAHNAAGEKSYVLHLPSVNMIGSVFVNGQLCGTSKAPFAVWDCDVSKAVNPGVNEVVVALKDVFYGLADKGDEGHPQYIPFDFWHYNTTNQLDFPVLGRYEAGILQTPTLIEAGRVYTADVFVLPSVKQKSLGLEVTLHNPTGAPMDAKVENAVVPLGGGGAEKTFAAQSATVAANGDTTLKLREAWQNPKLWWPDAPAQYEVVTRVSLGGKVVDERRTKFGFREWEWDGATFKLNGVPWHGRADTEDMGDPQVVVTHWKARGQNMMRLWNESDWHGMERDAALDFFDQNGVPVRRTGIFDGEGAAGFYNLTEQNAAGQTVARAALFDNWRAQLAAWVKGQRNHPSIFIWSMENEITFINSSVFGLNPQTDPEMKRASDLLLSVDPTRPNMTDGGNALLDESLPVYGFHYMEPSLSSLPEGAYDEAGFRNRQKWPVTKRKPVLAGEAFYADGLDLPQLATVGGESAFVGKAEAKPAVGLAAKMLSEGYRWLGYSFHFWYGGAAGPVYYNSWQPRAVLCRQWDWSFGSGQTVTRTLGVFNDTHFADPLELNCTLLVNGKVVSRQTKTLPIPAGEDRKFDVQLALPTVAARTEGQWVLTLAAKGKEVFRDAKPLSILPAPTFAALPQTKAGWRASALVKPTAPKGSAGLLVFDPNQKVAPLLRARGARFTEIKSLDNLPTRAKVLLVGPDALDERAATSTALAAWASDGRGVVVLEQKNPLHFSALPGQMDAAHNAGNLAFPEDLDHPLLRGLKAADFQTWSGDGRVYRDAYVKPASGGKSLVQCDDGLRNSALVQMNVGQGTLLLSQLVVGEKASSSPVAVQLLANLLSYAASYKLVSNATMVVAGGNAPLQKALDAAGLEAAKSDDVLSLLSGKTRVAVVDASPQNLAALAANKAKLQTWTGGGGWLVLNNLTPDGLAAFNKIVGVEHLIRPYGREKVSFPAVRPPLTAGLATSNVVMGSGKQIFNWAAGQYPDEEAYSFVVDTDDIAPFAKSSFGSYGQITNGYTMNDGFWPLIIDFELPKDGSPFKVPITFVRPEKIASFGWAGSANYRPATQIALALDSGPTKVFDVAPNNDTQTLEVNSPTAVSGLTLELRAVQASPDKGLLSGIGNIWIHPQRAADWNKRVRPLLNIGALVEYPQGAGGVVLCNVRFKDAEANPENTGKKQAILATILRNLGSPFSGGKTVIAGAANLVYTPVDLSKAANAFRGEQGWFGEKGFSFADLPSGDQTFAGVKYNVYHFKTSPVPEAVMLGGNGVPGNLPDAVKNIAVNRKADALFFLQAARLDARKNGDDLKQGRRFEMADYIVHYADGQTAKVPVYAEESVENYRQTKAATPLSGAQIGWSAPYTGTDQVAAAYSMQWTNPRPDAEIASVDLQYGPDRRGPVALLALSAATAK